MTQIAYVGLAYMSAALILAVLAGMLWSQLRATHKILDQLDS